MFIIIKLKCILFMVMLLFILSVSTVSANSDFVNETLSVDNSYLIKNLNYTKIAYNFF